MVDVDVEVTEGIRDVVDRLLDSMKCIPVSLVKRLAARTTPVNKRTIETIVSKRMQRWGWRWAIRGVYCNCEKSYKPIDGVTLTLDEAAKMAVAELAACGNAATIDELVERAAWIYELYGGRVDEKVRRRLRTRIQKIVSRVARLGYDEKGRISPYAVIA